MASFYSVFERKGRGDLRQVLEQILGEDYGRRVNQKGELLDSDEDSDGNLK
jgi:hypothetical protein